MKVFLTGGSGFVGTGILRELLAHGHSVTALARSPESAAKLQAAGATPRQGELTDLTGLRAAAVEADAVIHCAFIHDFANFASSITTDRRAVEAMLDALASTGSPRIFINTAGTAMLAPSKLAVETDNDSPASPAHGRAAAARATLDAASRGLRTAVLRLPPSVHGAGDHGFVPMLIDLAKKTRVAGFLGNGENRWPAVHRDDAAVLYRLAIEKLADGSVPPGSALHAVGDPGIPFRTLAQTIADRLGLGSAVACPPEHFTWMSMFAGIDNPASAAITQRLTGWQPTRAGLLEDLRGSAYEHHFQATPA